MYKKARQCWIRLLTYLCRQWIRLELGYHLIRHSWSCGSGYDRRLAVRYIRRSIVWFTVVFMYSAPGDFCIVNYFFSLSKWENDARTDGDWWIILAAFQPVPVHTRNAANIWPLLVLNDPAQIKLCLLINFFMQCRDEVFLIRLCAVGTCLLVCSL